MEQMLRLSEEPEFVFLTGDLGFGAFEELEKSAATRFINAGVAEQNMVSVAAGLAKVGFRPWVYSIAPFIYARALEQIRNDLVFHGLTATLVGNGGGLGYGVMGPTHLSFDDYGILSVLGDLNILIPAFPSDIEECATYISKVSGINYLRLSNVASTAEGFEVGPFQAWRRVLSGSQGLLVTTGALAADYINHYFDLEVFRRPEIWVVSFLPIMPDSIPENVIKGIETGSPLMVCEEHVWSGGLGMQLLAEIARTRRKLSRFLWRGVTQEVTSIYGSRAFLLNHLAISPQMTESWWVDRD